jgi:hypothetical protein
MNLGLISFREPCEYLKEKALAGRARHIDHGQAHLKVNVLHLRIDAIVPGPHSHVVDGASYVG